MMASNDRKKLNRSHLRRNLRRPPIAGAPSPHPITLRPLWCIHEIARRVTGYRGLASTIKTSGCHSSSHFKKPLCQHTYMEELGSKKFLLAECVSRAIFKSTTDSIPS